MTQTVEAQVENMIIGGKQVPSSSGATYEVKNPATGKVVATVARETPAEDRTALLFKGIKLLEQNKNGVAPGSGSLGIMAESLGSIAAWLSVDHEKLTVVGVDINFLTLARRRKATPCTPKRALI